MSYGPSLSTPDVEECTDDPQVIGPALPAHLLNKYKSNSSSLDDEEKDSCSNEESEEDDLIQTETVVIGPALPPNLSHSEQLSKTVGPVLPPHLTKKILESSVESKDSSDSSSDGYGPALPPHLQKVSVEDQSDDEDVYGPLPPGVSTSSQAHQALEERALQIKLNQLDSNEDKSTVREEWMMELPGVRTGNLGLGARQFRKNARPDFSDRSSWTDTPEQKANKLKGGKVEAKIDLKKEAELREIHKRDEEQAKMAEKHSKKKKRDRSLLEMHQEKQKKKKKDDEEEEGPSRRPFSREIDLQVNQLDDAQKKSIMKKAMLLDDRFSRGQSKFL